MSQSTNICYEQLCSILAGKVECDFIQDLTYESWSNLIELADRHRVKATLAIKLATSNTLELPTDIASECKILSKSQLQRSFALLAQQCKLSEMFSELDIPFIIMKGIAISHRFYPQPWSRESNDIDILIRLSDFDRAYAALSRNGFEQVTPPFPVNKNTFSMIKLKASGMNFDNQHQVATVELHWRFIQFNELLNWDFDTVSGHTEVVKIGDQNFAMIVSPFQLVYVCCHGAKHRWHRLKWILDVHMMVNHMDEAQLHDAAKIAEDNGISDLYHAALILAEMHFGTTIPSSTRRTAKVREIVAQTKNGLLEKDADQLSIFGSIARIYQNLRYWILLKSGISFKLKMFSRHLYGIDEIRTIGLSKKWLPIYWALGPIYFAVRKLIGKIRH